MEDVFVARTRESLSSSRALCLRHAFPATPAYPAAKNAFAPAVARAAAGTESSEGWALVSCIRTRGGVV